MTEQAFIELADGTKIDPMTGAVLGDAEPEQEQFVEVPNNIDAQQEITAVRRRLLDMPIPPDRMNVVSLVISYTLYGLDDREIGMAIQVDEDQVLRIKESEAYTHMYEAVVETIIAQDLDDVRASFVHASRNASKRVLATMNGKNGALAFKAAQDVLDRAGHRPADVVEHRHEMEGVLRIEIVEKSDGDEVPLIDVTPERINE